MRWHQPAASNLKNLVALRKSACAAAIVTMLLPGSSALAGELLHSFGIGTDPDYRPRFHLGDVRFQIPNRYLAFPWPTGEEPFDRAICADPAEVERRRLGERCSVALRSINRPAIMLKLPARGPDVRGVISDWYRNVAVQYRDRRRFPAPTVDEFAAEQDERHIRSRVEVLDTAAYAAFHDTWTGDQAKQAPAKLLAESEKAFSFISKSQTEPRYIWCKARTIPVAQMSQLWCTATVPYLADSFPQNADGTYPYLITYDFSGAEIDQAATIGAAVAATVSGFRAEIER